MGGCLHVTKKHGKKNLHGPENVPGRTKKLFGGKERKKGTKRKINLAQQKQVGTRYFFPPEKRERDELSTKGLKLKIKACPDINQKKDYQLKGKNEKRKTAKVSKSGRYQTIPTSLHKRVSHGERRETPHHQK